MLTIHGMADSGNCYKPRLLLALTGRPFRHAEVSWLDGGTDEPAFRARTAIGKVPLLELDDGRVLPESNAILCFLGEGTRFVPVDPFARATMLSWMFFEQYSHEPNVAVRRSLLVYPQMADAATPERLERTLKGGRRALGVMEARLAAADWLVGDEPTLADLALYAYTHVAGDGGFDLAETPAVERWLLRVEALDGFRPMSWLPR
jgi:glutathione S-transferase